MDTPPSPKPGWYPHPTMPETDRFWDGSQWTEHVAPSSQRQAGMPRVDEPRTSVSRTAAGVAIGVALVAVVAWGIAEAVEDSNRYDCVMENADRALDGSGLPLSDCD